MISPDKDLLPDWDEDNINHILLHGLYPDQIEEVYYIEGPFPTLAIENKKQHKRSREYRVYSESLGIMIFCELISDV